MSDLISRQDVIDALYSLTTVTDNDDVASGIIIAMGKIQGMPSAQPEIIRCKDCKHKPHTSDEYDYDNGDCGYEIIFPDYRCPCRCSDDEYYNRIPDDDWHCANAEPNEEGEKDG